MNQQTIKAARTLLAVSTACSPRTMFDRDVISFAHGDGLRRPSPKVLVHAVDDILATGIHSLDRYQYCQPSEALIHALLVKQRDWYKTSFDACTIGPGTTGLFQAIVRSHGFSKSSLIVSPGFYHAWIAWAEAAQMNFVVAPHEGDCLVDPTGFEVTVQNTSASVALLANPNYLGQRLTRDRAEAIAASVLKTNIFFIEDAIFSRDVHDSSDGYFVCQFLPRSYPCCIIDSGSKSFGLANARSGWMLGCAESVAKVRDLLDVIGPSHSYISQMLTLRSLEQSDGYLAENCRELIRPQWTC